MHVEIEGLSPARPYWYRFIVGEATSPVGRGATLPLASARVDRVRFAVAGCQHYEEGHFTAWRRIAEEPLDFVFHYGDYIYEGPDSGPGERKMNGRPFTNLRRHVGGEIYSLDDYRRRHAQYRSDRDLQAAHASAPWFVSFDDHEIDNNWASEIDQDGTPLYMTGACADISGRKQVEEAIKQLPSNVSNNSPTTTGNANFFAGSTIVQVAPTGLPAPVLRSS